MITKFGILSDIHGNIAALEAVLADAGRRGVDQFVNLGDICSGPLFPVETADRLIALSLPTIRGNHERQVLTQAAERMGPSDRHAATKLRKDQLQWLAMLPPRLRLSAEILMVHGTPESDLSYFLETVTRDGVRRATMAEVHERASVEEAAIILCGHTHIARAVALEDGRRIINPGSVGLPAYYDDFPFPHVIETGSPHARYAILTKEGSSWQPELIEVEYDWEEAAKTAQANDRPDWAHALRTGRMC